MSKGKFIRGNVSNINWNEDGDPFQWDKMLSRMKEIQRKDTLQYQQDTARKDKFYDAAWAVLDWVSDSQNQATESINPNEGDSTTTSPSSKPTNKKKEVDPKQTGWKRPDVEIETEDEFFDEEIVIEKVNKGAIGGTKKRKMEVGVNPTKTKYTEFENKPKPYEYKNIDPIIRPQIQLSETEDEFFDEPIDTSVFSYENATKSVDTSVETPLMKIPRSKTPGGWVINRKDSTNRTGQDSTKERWTPFKNIKERREAKKELKRRNALIENLDSLTTEARGSIGVSPTNVEFYDEDIIIQDTKLEDYDDWVVPKKAQTLTEEQMESIRKNQAEVKKAEEQGFIVSESDATSVAESTSVNEESIMELEEDDFVEAFEKASNTGDVSSIGNVRKAFNRYFKIKRDELGPGQVFMWTNPKTGKSSSYSTDTSDDVKARTSGSTWDPVNMRWIPKRSAKHGANYTTNGPEMLIVGDNPGGRERVIVEPLPAKGDNIALQALNDWDAGHQETSTTIAQKGRGGDTEIRMVQGEVSHVNPWEAFLVDNYGYQGEEIVSNIGAGTINPDTGLKEYMTGSQWGVWEALGGTWTGQGMTGVLGLLSNPWTMAIGALLGIGQWIGGAKDEADYYDDQIVYLNKQKAFINEKKGDVAVSGITAQEQITDLGTFEVSKLTNAYGNKLEELGDETRSNIKKTRGLDTGSVIADKMEEEQDLITMYNMDKEKLAYQQDVMMGQVSQNIRTNLEDMDLALAGIEKDLAYAHDHNETLENLF